MNVLPFYSPANISAFQKQYKSLADKFIKKISFYPKFKLGKVSIITK